MIEWIEFDPLKAPDEIEEDQWLILYGEDIINAMHDAMDRCFYKVVGEWKFVYSYQYISHYAKPNYPDNVLGTMISNGWRL